MTVLVARTWCPDRGAWRYTVANTFSRNSRLARAFAIVSSSVAPTAVPSTMIGPLKPKRLQPLEEAGEIDLAGAELDHDLVAAPVTFVAERRRADLALHEMRTGAILGDDAGHVGADDLEVASPDPCRCSR